jgi:hypothetical protein
MKNKLFYTVCAAIPAVLCLIYILFFGVNTIFEDELVMVELAQKINKSGLSFADLFTQHIQHRIFFPRLIYLGVAYLTNFNSVAQMIVSFVMLSIIASIVISYIIRQQHVSCNKKVFFITVVSAFIYSLIQWENLLWGFQVGFIMVLLFPVLSFHFLHLMFHVKSRRKKTFYFTIALLTAFIASFSSIQGLITWIVGIILMLIVFRDKFLTSFYFIAWTVAGILAWIIYFYDYVHSPSVPSITSFINNPIHFLLFFFSLIGNVVMIESFGYWALSVVGMIICIYLIITLTVL